MLAEAFKARRPDLLRRFNVELCAEAEFSPPPEQPQPEEKTPIVLAGPPDEDSIAELCGQEGIYYSWSKEILEAGKRWLEGGTAREVSTSGVKLPRRETRDLKEIIAKQALKLLPLKKSMIVDGIKYSDLI